ncbi:type VI secretion system lipoprotein TssJ [Roseibium sp. RKSG952]|uniref:type VI secretion system lipoprotein TssJ n=1 Tax=Roseibium sp. RKSG952 TaxID=2529384 RepID=UPI0012BC5262|nr:type VI secretion system lipoprotein TssJ [Roseibium sp. RKSG952]MTH98019.1 type VI secretion system lipoprotein TssJ [Roseibium sp. RKSG952]
MAFKSAYAAVIGLLVLTGCVSTSPSPTTVDLAITGSANMNGGAPAKVKVYYLASTAEFGSADFFTLFNTPEAALGGSLVAMDEFQLAPGRTVTGIRSVNGTPTAVGVVAAFRDIDNARFKSVRSLKPNAANRVRVTVLGNSVSVQ